MAWIGVDLDGTLAHYDHWRGVAHIGEPIKPMVDRVKAWLTEGKEVRIFTARVCYDGVLSPSYDEAQIARCFIEIWCRDHIGQVLPITFKKDWKMTELWDDRAIQVVPNTGLSAVEAALKRGAA